MKIYCTCGRSGNRSENRVGYESMMSNFRRYIGQKRLLLNTKSKMLDFNKGRRDIDRNRDKK